MFKEVSGLAPREEFISAMRQVASSVTVVTTDGVAGRAGATVSAFSSVSADPPTVLVCLFGESRIAKMVTENQAFCVNVLRESSAHLADRFAGRHDGDVNDRFDGVEMFGEAGEVPMISSATAFRCNVQQIVRSGSHVIVIGHVLEVWDGEDMPLTYRDGGYHKVIPHENQDIAGRN